MHSCAPLAILKSLHEPATEPPRISLRQTEARGRLAARALADAARSASRVYTGHPRRSRALAEARSGPAGGRSLPRGAARNRTSPPGQDGFPQVARIRSTKIFEMRAVRGTVLLAAVAAAFQPAAPSRAVRGIAPLGFFKNPFAGVSPEADVRAPAESSPRVESRSCRPSSTARSRRAAPSS